MNRYFAVRRSLAGLALLAGIGCSQAATSPNNPLADLSVSAHQAQWFTHGSASGSALNLRVSAPGGDVVEYQFAAGSRPVYPAYADDPMEDGTYTYELRLAVQVSPQTKAVATDGPVDENGRSLGKTPSLVAAAGAEQVQSGHFSIAQGILVDPNQVER